MRVMVLDSVAGLLHGQMINKHDDFFLHGLDSVRNIMLAKDVHAYVRTLLPDAEPVPPVILYRNPTVVLLEHAVLRFLDIPNPALAREGVTEAPKNTNAALKEADETGISIESAHKVGPIA